MAITDERLRTIERRFRALYSRGLNVRYGIETSDGEFHSAITVGMVLDLLAEVRRLRALLPENEVLLTQYRQDLHELREHNRHLWAVLDRIPAEVKTGAEAEVAAKRLHVKELSP